MPISATKSPHVPSSTLRAIMATLAPYCRPTAASEPSLLTENWRGYEPPAGASSSKVSAPVAGSMIQLCSESEAISVLLEGSQLGMLKSGALRSEVRTYLPSGCGGLADISPGREGNSR